MSNLTRNFFIALSNNKLLNKSAQKWGFRLGAEQFVAGVDVDSVLESVKKLNNEGISATVDHLGEFITEREKTIAAKENILKLLTKIKEEKVDCHVSVKLTQLGLDIEENFCLENMREIVTFAKKHGIFINIDTEDYAHYEQTLFILNELRKNFDNVGTVIQAYLYRAENDLDELQDVRLRMVKGAYKESEQVAFQSREDIDKNFLKLVKKRLKGHTFTSIATHDHNLINELKSFIEKENIDRSTFEFQMLYGFRTDMQRSLTKEGYRFCTYVPFGHDWFGYFMRRLAERPKNLNLILQDKYFACQKKLKRPSTLISLATLATLAYILYRKRN